MLPTLERPCIKQCCLNEEDVCVGCFRTFNDMKLWHKASVVEKKKILDEAKKRKETHLASLSKL